MYFRCRGYHYYEGFVDYIKRLPLAPHRCRSAPHQLPLATAVCSGGLLGAYTTKGQRPGKKEMNMTRKAQTYLTRIKRSGSIYDLQGIEIAFKQDSTLDWDDIVRLCKAVDEKRYTLTNGEDTIRLKNLHSSG